MQLARNTRLELPHQEPFLRRFLGTAALPGSSSNPRSPSWVSVDQSRPSSLLEYLPEGVPSPKSEVNQVRSAPPRYLNFNRRRSSGGALSSALPVPVFTSLPPPWYSNSRSSKVRSGLVLSSRRNMNRAPSPPASHVQGHKSHVAETKKVIN